MSHGVGRAWHKKGRSLSFLLVGVAGAWVRGGDCSMTGRERGTGGATVKCGRLVKEKDIFTEGESRSERRWVIYKGSI